MSSLDAASPSESSEFMSPDRASDIIGSDVEWSASGLWASLGSGMDSPFCFFFGCGSTRDDDRCFDRTGTGVVVRVGAVGKVIVCCGPRNRIRTRVRHKTGRSRCTSGENRCIDWWRAC